MSFYRVFFTENDALDQLTGITGPSLFVNQEHLDRCSCPIFESWGPSALLTWPTGPENRNQLLSARRRD
ncbi:MAG: hypothetical protein AAF492_00915 [Verrucomicrobiota bacterium]